jgi:hypothetical protein
VHKILRVWGIIFLYFDIVTDILSLLEFRELKAWISYYFMIGVFIASRIFSFKIALYIVESEKKFNRVWKDYLFSSLLIITFYEPIYLYKK